MPSCFNPLTVIGLMSITLAAGLFPLMPAIARSPAIRWTPPPPPPTTTEPKTLPLGGGRRGPCDRYQEVVAVVPSTAAGVRWGQTTRDHLTVWLYAPQGFADGLVREMAIEDAQGTQVATYRLPTKPLSSGISKVEMPNTSPPLQVGKPYRWKVFIYCDVELPDTPFTIQGMVQRVSLPTPVQRQITDSNTPLAKAKLYAENGVWYDALTTLGNYLQSHRHSSDQESHQAWSELLQQSGLKQLDAIDLVSVQSSRIRTTRLGFKSPDS